jgi:hypothetical protein
MGAFRRFAWHVAVNSYEASDEFKRGWNLCMIKLAGACSVILGSTKHTGCHRYYRI